MLDVCVDWLRPIVLVAIHTGMRIGEILALSWENINFKSKEISIEKTKNDEPRSIPMTGEVWEMLLKKRELSNSTGYVFVTKNGTSYRHRNVHRTFVAALKKVNIQNFRIHDLRHTFASQFMMSGGDIYTLSKLLGHKSITTTTIYAHLASHFKKFAVMSFEAHLNNKKHPEPVKEYSHLIPSR